MSHINPNILFQTGWSTSQKIESNELDKYLKAFTALTTQVREDIAATKGISVEDVSSDHVTVSTTVKEGANSKLIMENCSNMLDILEASKSSKELDDKTLAKLNALLQAAVDESLEVVYKDVGSSQEGGRQELIILSNFGSGQAPKTTGVHALFDAAHTNTTIRNFTDEYRGKLEKLERFWVNPTTQDVKTPEDDKIETAHLSGFKDAPKGSAAEEELNDFLHTNRKRDVRERIEDEADQDRLREERKKDREDIIQDRNEAFRDAKQSRKLDQASQRAHGENVDKTTDST